MKSTNNPFDGLDIENPEAKYEDGRIKQKAFFEFRSDESQLIPLGKRITILAKFIYDGYDLHKIVNDYLDDNYALDDDTQKYCIASTFKAYTREIFIQSETDWRKAVAILLIGDGDEKESASEELRESIEAFIEVVSEKINDLKRENVTVPDQVPTYLFRTNFFEKDAYDVDKLMNDLYENNIVSINVKDKKNESDEKYVEALKNGNKERLKIPDYIIQFYSIVEQLEKSDVMIVAYYFDKSPKIGLIKQNSKDFCKKEAGEIYKLYCLQMENVHRIADKRKELLDTLIPVRKAITPIKKKAEVIHCIYYGLPFPFELSSVSDSNLEKLCTEYLLSCLSFKSAKVLGGNFPDIDILGNNQQDESFAAQVSSTESKTTIVKKIEKLCAFKQAEHKIMFSTLASSENSDYKNINIQEVWNYFEKHDKKFLEKLIEL